MFSTCESQPLVALTRVELACSKKPRRTWKEEDLGYRFFALLLTLISTAIKCGVLIHAILINYVAFTSKPGKWSDKEARQVEVHRKYWSGMDISDCKWGCSSMQLHVAHMQREQFCSNRNWHARLQCLNLTRKNSSKSNRPKSGKMEVFLDCWFFWTFIVVYGYMCWITNVIFVKFWCFWKVV